AGACDDEADASGYTNHADHHWNHHQTSLSWRQGVHHLQVGWHVAENTHHRQAQDGACEGGQNHVAVLEKTHWNQWLRCSRLDTDRQNSTDNNDGTQAPNGWGSPCAFTAAPRGHQN